VDQSRQALTAFFVLVMRKLLKRKERLDFMTRKKVMFKLEGGLFYTSRRSHLPTPILWRVA
jgi:hypothetical protein